MPCLEKEGRLRSTASGLLLLILVDVLLLCIASGELCGIIVFFLING